MICQREFYASLLVINTRGFNVILDIGWLNTNHVVIVCRKRSIIFRMLSCLEFKVVGGNNYVEPVKFKALSHRWCIIMFDVFPLELLVILEFKDISKDFLGLPQDRSLEFVINLILDT